VIIADNHGRVVEMNRAAESIVGLEDGLNIRKDRLGAGRAFETDKIGKLIAGATTHGELGAAAGRMLVRRCNSLPPYVLTIVPLRTDTGDDRQFALIVVVDPARHSPSEKDLTEFFGLSPAEARLAASLLTGKTLNALSDRGQYWGSDYDTTHPAWLHPEKIGGAAAVRSDPCIIEHRDRFRVFDSRVPRCRAGGPANFAGACRSISASLLRE